MVSPGLSRFPLIGVPAQVGFGCSNQAVKKINPTWERFSRHRELLILLKTWKPFSREKTQLDEAYSK